MFWMWFLGSGLAIQGFDAHVSHPCGHMLAACLEALTVEQIAQHSGIGKQIFQMQSINPIDPKYSAVNYEITFQFKQPTPEGH